MRILTLDVGGKRQPMVGVVEDGRVISAAPHPFVGLDDFMEMLGALAQLADAISLAMPGPIVANGDQTLAPNLPEFRGVPLSGMIERLTGKPTRLYNDMSTAATGMAYLLPDLPNFLALTLSSGVGARHVRGGRVVDHEVEFGHVRLSHDPEAPYCGCGGRGCAEAYLGGKVGKQRIQNVAMQDGRHVDSYELSPVWQIAYNPAANAWYCLDRAFEADEPWANAFYSEYALSLGRALAAWRTCVAFDTVVYKGTLGLHLPQRVWKMALGEMEHRLTINQDWAKVTLLPSPAPETDALIGAALLFEQDA